MKSQEVVYTSFRDELEKISGMVRSGKPAVTVANALKGKGRFFKGIADKGKLAAVNPRHVMGGIVTGGVATLYGQKKLKKLHQDYQMGRQMRQAGA